MKKIQLPLSLLLSGYGSLLLLIAFYFLMQDNALHKLKGDMPLPFILRFGTFWIISLLLALLFYLVSLKASYVNLSSANQQKSRLLGLLAFGLAIICTALTVAVIYLF